MSDFPKKGLPLSIAPLSVSLGWSKHLQKLSVSTWTIHKILCCGSPKPMLLGTHSSCLRFEQEVQKNINTFYLLPEPGQFTSFCAPPHFKAFTYLASRCQNSVAFGNVAASLFCLALLEDGGA